MKQTRLWFPTILLLVSLLVGCKPSRDITGAWVGTLDAGHLKLRLVLHIKHDGIGYKATIDSIDQGRKDLPITSIKIKASDVHVELAAFNGVYDARINTNGNEMAGLFRQADASIPFTMKKTSQPPTIAPPLLPAAYTPRAGSDLQGYWQGSLNIAGVPMRLAFKISEQSQGKFRAELDSIDQASSGIPVTTVAYEPPAVRMTVAGVSGTLEGTVDRTTGHLTGTWRQGPNTLPITLRRKAPPAVEPANYKFTKDTEPQGTWAGTLDAKTVALKLVLRIGKMPNGSYVAKLDSPDRGSADIAASSVQFTPPSSLNVEWEALHAGFQAELKSGKLVGTWTQMKQTYPMTMRRDNTAK